MSATGERFVEAIRSLSPERMARHIGVIVKSMEMLGTEDRIAVEYVLFVETHGAVVLPMPKGLELA
jgi:hypothetical protein